MSFSSGSNPESAPSRRGFDFFSFLRDVREGLRTLRRGRGLTLVAWLSLAFGIGALTAIFSVIQSLLLEPLPYANAERLVLLWESDLASPERRMGGTSAATFEDWRRQTRSYETLSALAAGSLSPTAAQVPESLFTRSITASHFPLFGITPILGRTFTEGEEAEGAKVVLLSHGVWQRLFGGDPSILGQKVEFDYQAYEVVGVMPADYRSPIEPAPVQLWVPLTIDNANPNRQRRRHLVYGRLAEDVSLVEAQRELATVTEELKRLYPRDLGGRGAEVQLIQEVLVGGFRPVLLTLFAAGGFLLLIVCANVAHLLLLRAMARRREMAVRTALGASRFQLLRQLGMESLLLSLAGAGAGLGFAYGGLWLLKDLIPERFDLPRLDAVSIDIKVLFFTLGIAIFTAALFSLAPMRIALARFDLGRDLSAGSARSTGGRGKHLLRGLLVVMEVALVLVLLISAGLMVQTLAGLNQHAMGRDVDQVLTMRTGLRGANYQEAYQKIDFFRRAEEAVSAIPGVEGVGATDFILLRNRLNLARFTLAGKPAEVGSEPEAQLQSVTPGYFDALGIPLLQGRLLTARDSAESSPTALVNRRFAETFLAGVEAGVGIGDEVIGQRFSLLQEDGASWEIVGLVDNVRTTNTPPDPVATIYVPYAQRPMSDMTLVVRTGPDPTTLSRSIQSTILGVDPQMPTFAVTVLADAVAEADWQSRFSMALLGFFASLALLLALTGIYAVMSSNVAERTREFGIRMAFGANPGHMRSLVLGHGLRLALMGLILGLVAAFPFTRLLESQLYGVKGTDLWTYVGLSALLLVTVLVACYFPARRATRLDPIESLRRE